MSRFENKVAIVTGAGGGIGQVYAEALAREGAAVVIADINVEGAEKVAAGIKALRAMAEADFGVNTSVEQVMRLMVPFLAAGMRADTGLSDTALIGATLKPRSKPQLAVAKP